MNHDIFPSPVKLLTDAVTKFNPEVDDPLSFTLKIWQNTLCGFEQQDNSTSIKDYSTWHHAIDSIISAYCLSTASRKTKMADYPFLKVISWFVFYNEDQLSPGIVKFLGGHEYSRKEGYMQKCTHFLEYLAGNSNRVKLDLYAAFCDFYDVEFVEKNLLIRYDCELARAFLLEIEVPTKIPKGKELTIPKSPYLRTKPKLDKLTKYRMENMIRKQEENTQDKIVYASHIPTSTYIPDKVQTIPVKRETSIHEFNLSHQHQSNFYKVRERAYADVMARVDSFHSKPAPDTTHIEKIPVKHNSNTVLRQIANFKSKQDKLLNSILNKQYGDDESYQRFIAEAELVKSIEEFEKSQANILSSQFSFENAILAIETVKHVKTLQTKQLKTEIQKSEQKRKLDEELLLNQKQSYAEYLKEKIKLDVERSKQAHFENNQNSVKIQTEEMKKMVGYALQKVRAEFQEKYRMIKEIQEFQNSLKLKMANYKNVFDKLAIYGEGNLLCEMSFREVQIRYEKMKQEDKFEVERKNVDIKAEKLEKEVNRNDTFEKLKKFDENERRRNKLMKDNKIMLSRKSMENFRSDTLDMMKQNLEAARRSRLLLQQKN